MSHHAKACSTGALQRKEWMHSHYSHDGQGWTRVGTSVFRLLYAPFSACVNLIFPMYYIQAINLFNSELNFQVRHLMHLNLGVCAGHHSTLRPQEMSRTIGITICICIHLYVHAWNYFHWCAIISQTAAI